MKSNFDFLNRYWPALAQIGATAETYVYSDPNACIYKLGMFAERLVQEILVFEHIAEPAVDNTHANRIRILKRAGLLPHEIDNTLYVLRKTRNSAVHIGTDSVDEAKTLLSLTYNLAVWFMETYGDWGYIAPEFVMPSGTTHEDLESVIAEQERKIEELTKQLAVVKTAASGKTQKERARRSESVSAMMNWNEAQTRCLIDEQLRLSGWEADTQNLRYCKGEKYCHQRMAYQFGLLQKRVCGLCILRWREARSIDGCKKDVGRCGIYHRCAGKGLCCTY